MIIVRNNTVLGKRYVLGRWQAIHPPPEFAQSEIDVSVMPIFDVTDITAPDMLIDGCC